MAALEWRIATNFCANVEKCRTIVVAEFRVNRTKGSRVTADSLSKITFSLRKASGQYNFAAQYRENGMQYRAKNWHACSLACSPALLLISRR